MRCYHTVLSLWLGAALVSAADIEAPNVRSLSLEDCVQMALEHNLDVQIERISPQLAKYNLSLAYAGYDPNFTIQGVHSFNTSPGSVDPATRLTLPPSTTDVNRYNAGLTGVLPFGLGYNASGNLVETYGQRTLQPFENTSGGATISLNQPLLRDFWIDATRMTIQVRRKDIKSSELGLRLQIMNIINQVEQAYYDLISTIENVKVQEKALELANRLLAESKKRVEVGAMAPLDEKQAESQVATTKANLLVARQQQATQQNILKRLINDNYSAWQTTDIQPAQPLTAPRQLFNLQDSWQQGLSERPDLLQNRIELEKQDIVLRYNRNQLFPELDLVGSYGHNGASPFRSDFSRVLGQLEEGSSPSYSYGAVLSIPLSNRSARYNYRSNKAVKARLILQHKRLEQDIMVQIDDAIKRAQTAFERVGATAQARAFAEEALKAEQTKLENGKSTSFIVLQLQSDLTSARSAEISALADYNKSLAQLSFYEASILRRNKVDVKVK